MVSGVLADHPAAGISGGTPPLIGNQYISMLKATSLIGYIGVVDIVQAGKIKATLSSNNIEAYFAEVLIYWGMTLLLE